MARIRSIKPTFFLDSDIASLSPMARIFFIGLWCLADREGRLKDKPRELGVQLIPYDLPNADPEALLKELAPRFILRYEVEGRGYLYIRGFEKHQRPANSEPDSDIPEPPADILATKKKVRKGRERKGKERKGKEALWRTPPPSNKSGITAGRGETRSTPLNGWPTMRATAGG